MVNIAIPVGWGYFNIPSIIALIIIEVILFWLLLNKSFKIEVNPWKSLLIVAVANIVTSLVGMLLPIYNLVIFMNILFYFILLILIISFFVEWGIYLLFFLKNKKKIKSKLLITSIIVNVVGYILFSIYIYL